VTISIFYIRIVFFFLAIASFYYLSNIIIKFIFYFILNKNLKGFKICPFLMLDYPVSEKSFWGYGSPLRERYYMIYVYNNKIYDEIREYFLNKNDIDICFISKNYYYL
jgi:hypothetical protein